MLTGTSRTLRASELATLLVASLAASGCLQAAWVVDPPHAERTHFRSENPDGAIAYELRGPAPFNVTVVPTIRWNPADFNPFIVYLISLDGRLLDSNGNEYDDAHNMRGDGIIYVGASGKSVSANGSSGAPKALTGLMEFTSRDPVAILTIQWARQEGPVEFIISGQDGLRITERGRASVKSFEMRDLEGGTRLGVPLASVHVGDHWRQVREPGNSTLLTIKVLKSSLARGTLEVRDGERTMSYDLASKQQTCGRCFEGERIILSTTKDVVANVEYAGDNGGSRIYIVASSWTEGTVPSFSTSVHDNFPT